jgi:hypothetical protein
MREWALEPGWVAVVVAAEVVVAGWVAAVEVGRDRAVKTGDGR